MKEQFKNFSGTVDELKEVLEELFEHEDIGYRVVDFWSYNEWSEIDWQEVLETRQEEKTSGEEA